MQRLQALIEDARESWTYAIFWQSSYDYSGASAGAVLGWGEGFYKDKQDKVKARAKTTTSAAEQEYRKKVLRDLNSLISGADTSADNAVVDQEVTDTEWFFLVSMAAAADQGENDPSLWLNDPSTTTVEVKDPVNASAPTSTSNQPISKPIQFDNHPSSSSLPENPSSVQVPQLQQQVQQQRTQSFFPRELNFSDYNGYDPHSIAERLRRERVAEKMKALQELVPNANKTDKASMLDEIINYVKFLQLQVKVLSMSRLGGTAAVAPLVADMSSEPCSREMQEMNSLLNASASATSTTSSSSGSSSSNNYFGAVSGSTPRFPLPASTSLKFNCCSSSLPSSSSMNCFPFQKSYQPSVKVEEHNFFSSEEACSFFSDEQAPSLQWYCPDQWN